MKIYNVIQLKEAASKSYSFSDVCRFLNFFPNNRNRNRFKDSFIKNDISFSHFRLGVKNIKYRTIEKKCPICNIGFKTQLNHKREKKYCSHKCANKFPLGNRRTKETNLKVSEGLKRYFLKVERIIHQKQCAFCKKTFEPHNKDTICCSRKCSGKNRWRNIEYRNYFISKLKEKIKNGEHKGWQSRKKLSYPEKFFKKVLELNGFKDKFKINFPVTKKELGIDCSSCYFLDFYFPEPKVNLEIDGKQHEYPDRKESDTKRDNILKGKGYRTYRIKWREINSPEGKNYIREEINKFLNYINPLVTTI
ncbi:MAG: DUF559 domain-containing protein [Nanoarchaeota archaeon]